MIRALAVALLLALGAASQALAQSHPSDAERAARALAAIWRPITAADMATPSAVETACRGALEEMGAVEAALPTVIDPVSLAQVRALRGLLIVPAGEDPAVAYFFPNRDLGWFTSGLGAITVLSPNDGLIGVRDAGGHDIAFQLGHLGGKPILRIRDPGGAILNFVGCASTSPP
jgi:hypothetical protein